VRTGLGVDSINPRVYGQATGEAREAVAMVLNQAERSLCWPQQINLLVYFMLVKPEGGLRGIAKLPSLIRLWEKIRYPLVARWDQRAARKYDWACAGGTAEMAVWTQLLEAEGLQEGDGPEVQGRAAALLDLVKCFERVRLHHVWRWGLYWEVPPKLLRMLFAYYSPLPDGYITRGH